MQRKPTSIRQEEIKNGILDIIADEGLHALSTRRLAKKVGVSEGTLFRHFASKRDMLLSIIEDVQNGLMEQLRAISQNSGSAENRLQEFLCTHINFLIKHRGITILLFSEATQKNDTELKQHLQSIFLKQKEYISKIIQDGITEGLWDSTLHVENIAWLYLGIPITLNIELAFDLQSIRPQDFCQKTMYLLKRMLRKNHPS